MAMKTTAFVSTFHALATLAIAFSSVSRSRKPETAVYAMGYIVAAEPLWRASHASIFWESGKYAIAALALLALGRLGPLRRADKTPLLYFSALLPSLLVLPQFDRQDISFNLSGPFALAMCTMFLSTIPIPSRVLGRALVVTLAPIFGLAAIATFSTVTTEHIDFFNSKVASAGLGPNQASSILGLGGLLAFLHLFIEKGRLSLRWVIAGIGIWCTVQGALTFSRGGIATAAGAIAAASFFLLQDRRSRSALILRVALVLGLAAYAIVPAVDSFTGGALLKRFSSADLTGRDRIIEADLIAFRENPILGVGPGQSESYHVLTFRYSAAHTEYSRLLAEHGSFGFFALLLLGWMSLRRITRRAPAAAKALTAAFTVWALLSMFHAAMRLAAVAFVFALGAAYLLAEAPLGARFRRHRVRLIPQPAPRLELRDGAVSAPAKRVWGSPPGLAVSRRGSFRDG